MSPGLLAITPKHESAALSDREGSGIALRACVIGSSGGIGSALVTALARQNPDGSVYSGSRCGTVRESLNVRPFRCDVTDEETIAAAARQVGQGGPLDLIIVATGILHGEGLSPEKTFRAIDPHNMHHVFAVNTIGPALVAKHFLPLLRKDRRSVFAALGARVGSIGDNRLGGWHSYRASKAALVMLVRNFAIELRRANPAAIAVTLHPGTVATPLSAPFRANLPEGQLVDATASARNLLRTIGELSPGDSGGHFSWDGKPIEA